MGATLRYHGHCAFELRVSPENNDADFGLLLDPWRDAAPPARRWFERPFPRLRGQIDVIASTHPHFDHDAVEAAAHDDVTVVRGGTATFSDALCKERSFGGGSVRLTAVTDEHAPASHAVWSVGRPAMRNTMFVFELADGLRALHMGDNRAELPTAILKRLGRIDVLFLTIDDACHLLTFEQVGLLESQVKPRVIIPMHYAMDGLTHRLAIESAGVFGGNGLGRLDRWLEQRAAQGGIVRHINSIEPMRLSRSDYPFAASTEQDEAGIRVGDRDCAGSISPLAETWVMAAWRASVAAEDCFCQPCHRAAAAISSGTSFDSRSNL